jgi:hypothetical protein
MKKLGEDARMATNKGGHWIAAGFVTLAAANCAHAEMSAEQLAKLTQNPVANLISVPFQNNTNLNFGPDKRNQNILNIQPVIPITLNQDWNLITRTIVPVISQPVPDGDRVNGIGDVQFSAFLSPANAQGLIWGAGAIVQAPTDTNEVLGNPRWGLGPTAVVLKLEKGNPWVYGVLVNNVWSIGGPVKWNNTQQGGYSNLLVQPFLNYNFPGGTYLTSSPIITAAWRAESSDRWTVPIGGGVGHIFHIGRLPVNAQIGGYYNIVRPDYGPNWQIRFQVQLLFPK